MIEPAVGDLVVVEAGVAHVAFAYHGVFGGAGVAAVEGGGDDGVLLVGGVAFGVLADEVVGGEIGAGGDVVPSHHPEAGDVDGHGVGLPDAALAPSGVAGGAGDHVAAGGVGHDVAKDSLGSADVGDEVFFGEVLEGFCPVDGRHLGGEVEEFGGGDEVGLEVVGGNWGGPGSARRRASR